MEFEFITFEKYCQICEYNVYYTSGCNRNDKVVGTFAHISLFFPDFDSGVNLTKIELHNHTIHMSSHE